MKLHTQVIRKQIINQTFQQPGRVERSTQNGVRIIGRRTATHPDYHALWGNVQTAVNNLMSEIKDAVQFGARMRW